jgi:hypothetical protein
MFGDGSDNRSATAAVAVCNACDLLNPQLCLHSLRDLSQPFKTCRLQAQPLLHLCKAHACSCFAVFYW